MQSASLGSAKVGKIDGSTYRTELALAYQNARFFDVCLHSSSPEMGSAVNSLIPRLRMTRAAKVGHVGNLKRCLTAVISNLLKHQTSDQSRYTAYSRTYNGYAASPDSNPFRIKWDGMKRVVDGLVELSCITNAKGFYFHEHGHGKKSRMRAEPHFISLLAQGHNLSAKLIEKHYPPGRVVLRDDQRQDMNYPETPLTQHIRRDLIAYNSMLETSDIGLDLSEVEIEELGVNLDARYYHRVFNQGSFNLGGRYAGPWWLYAAPDIRKLILIDGETTVECDYSGQHIHLLYSLCGLRYFDVHRSGDDPYLLPDFPENFRKLVKKATWAMFGSKSFRGAVRSVRNWMKDNSGYEDVDPGVVIKSIQEKHKVIDAYFNSRPAWMLQYLDSLIATEVITRMIYRQVPVLCVHDSFIVQRRFEGELRRVMTDAFSNNGFKSVPLITNNLGNVETQGQLIPLAA